MTESEPLELSTLPPPTWASADDAHAFLTSEAPQIAGVLEDLAVGGIVPPPGAIADLGWLVTAASQRCETGLVPAFEDGRGRDTADALATALGALVERAEGGGAIRLPDGREHQLSPTTLPLLAAWLRSALAAPASREVGELAR